MKEFLTEVFGDKNAASWAAAFVFIFMGAIISLGIHSQTRDKESRATPQSFSVGFLIRDNFVRFIASVFVCFVVVRFGEQLTGRQITGVACIGLGLVFDQALIYAKKWQDKARDVFKAKERKRTSRD